MTKDIHARFRLCFGAAAAPALDVDLHLPGQGVTAVFGPSGAGKTSLLRCIAGLQACPGRLQVRDELWQDAAFNLPAHRRPVGYVFQEASLFPHLNVRDNLRFALRRGGGGGAKWGALVELMDLAPLLDRKPMTLSGGERQRGAIARALLVEPRLLLMDEPMAALDARRKRDIFPYLERMRTELEIPVLYVSHSLDEVARLADHIVVLEQGRLQMAGCALDIMPRLRAPEGDDESVLIEARVAGQDDAWGLQQLKFSGGQLWIAHDPAQIGEQLRVRIRARDVSLSLDAQTRSSILNRLAVTVEAVQPVAESAHAMLHLRAGETLLLARLTRRSVAELALQPGVRAWAQIKAVAVLR